MRALVAEWLVADGYDVLEFSAVAMAEPALASATVLILDVSSERSTRSAFLAGIRMRHPRLIVIGLSTRLSRSLPGDSALARSLGLAWIVAKPCERQELLDAVRIAMADGRA